MPLFSPHPHPCWAPPPHPLLSLLAYNYGWLVVRQILFMLFMLSYKVWSYEGAHTGSALQLAAFLQMIRCRNLLPLIGFYWCLYIISENMLRLWCVYLVLQCLERSRPLIPPLNHHKTRCSKMETQRWAGNKNSSWEHAVFQRYFSKPLMISTDSAIKNLLQKFIILWDRCALQHQILFTGRISESITAMEAQQSPRGPAEERPEHSDRVSDSQMSAWHASWFCEAVNSFIAICVRQESRAAAQKILAGARLLCESAAAVSCQKHTPLLSDWSRNTAAIQHHLKTYGATLTESSYAQVVLILPMIIYTDSGLSRLLLVKPDSP